MFLAAPQLLSLASWIQPGSSALCKLGRIRRGKGTAKRTHLRGPSMLAVGVQPRGSDRPKGGRTTSVCSSVLGIHLIEAVAVQPVGEVRGYDSHAWRSRLVAVVDHRVFVIDEPVADIEENLVPVCF